MDVVTVTPEQEAANQVPDPPDGQGELLQTVEQPAAAPATTAAKDRWLAAFPRPGVWLGVDDSQKVVGDPTQFPEVCAKLNDLEPNPGFVAVKFGGDWGGMWGNPDLWGQLVGAYPPGNVVPYLFCTPEHVSSYRDMVGGLFQLGYPAVILDCEEQWAGFESSMRSMLQGLNLDQNLIGVTGYAWFGAFPDGGAAFGKCIRDLNIVYLPQAYLSELTVAQPGTFMADQLAATGIDQLPLSYVLDANSVPAATVLEQQSGLPASVWHLGTVDRVTWRTVFGAALTPAPVEAQPEPAPEAPAETTVTEPVQAPAPFNAAVANTNLGQALDYCDKLRTALVDVETDDEENLIKAIELCIHTARQATGGE